MTNRRPQIDSRGSSVLRRLYGFKRDEVGKDGSNYITRKFEILGFKPNIKVVGTGRMRWTHGTNDRDEKINTQS